MKIIADVKNYKSRNPRLFHDNALLDVIRQNPQSPEALEAAKKLAIGYEDEEAFKKYLFESCAQIKQWESELDKETKKLQELIENPNAHYLEAKLHIRHTTDKLADGRAEVGKVKEYLVSDMEGFLLYKSVEKELQQDKTKIPKAFIEKFSQVIISQERKEIREFIEKVGIAEDKQRHEDFKKFKESKLEAPLLKIEQSQNIIKERNISGLLGIHNTSQSQNKASSGNTDIENTKYRDKIKSERKTARDNPPDGYSR